MPTYEYECQACGHTFDRWQEMSASKLRTCPECGKRRLLRLVGAGAGVIFRGSGFYETDYKRKRGSPPKTESSGSPKASSSSSATKEGGDAEKSASKDD